jgi:antitoxin component of MazEF toxin-antitoxin module
MLNENRMTTTVKFKMWGNSLGIRLPSAIARSMHLEDGMVADLTVENGHIHIAPHSKQVKPLRKRRPLSFYEARARKRDLTNLIDAIEIIPNDVPRGLEMM